jgi:F420-non-reducing hydrogenase iron-sulfur subunit
MVVKAKAKQPKILALASSHCAYPGADAVGQSHIEYPSNVYILEVVDPVMFPEDFYLSCFQKGIGGIIVMSCGNESPYEGVFAKTAERIQRVHKRMKELGWDTQRLRLTSICTVCIKTFLKEVDDMNNLLQELGPIEPAAKDTPSS